MKMVTRFTTKKHSILPPSVFYVILAVYTDYFHKRH